MEISEFWRNKGTFYFNYLNLKGLLVEASKLHEQMGNCYHQRIMLADTSIDTKPFTMEWGAQGIKALSELQTKYYELGLQLRNIGVAIENLKLDHEKGSENVNQD